MIVKARFKKKKGGKATTNQPSCYLQVTGPPGDQKATVRTTHPKS